MVRAQSGIEFITGVTVMLVIYVIALGGYSYYSEQNVIEDSFAKHICYTFSDGVNAAIIGGSGFSLNFSIPYHMYVEDVKRIIVSDYTATVEWGSRISGCSIMTDNITDVPVYPGKISATNINGTIYLTSIATNASQYASGAAVGINASYILGASANIIIVYSNGTTAVGPVTRAAVNNVITYTWSTTGKPADTYKIFVFDDYYKNLNAQNEVRII